MLEQIHLIQTIANQNINLQKKELIKLLDLQHNITISLSTLLKRCTLQSFLMVD